MIRGKSMREYADIVFEENRAFNVNTMEELLTEGKAIRIEVIDISGRIESSVARIAAIYKATSTYNTI